MAKKTEYFNDVVENTKDITYYTCDDAQLLAYFNKYVESLKMEAKYASSNENDLSIEPKITPMILPISGLPVGHPNIELFKEAQSFHKIIGQAYEVLKYKKKK